MTLPRLRAMRREWRANPPVHHLVAAAVKYRPPREADAVSESPGKPGAVSIAALKAAFPNRLP